MMKNDKHFRLQNCIKLRYFECLPLIKLRQFYWCYSYPFKLINFVKKLVLDLVFFLWNSENRSIGKIPNFRIEKYQKLHQYN